MNRIVSLGCALGLILALGAATGCGDPCEKFFNQYVKCRKVPKDAAKEMKKKALKECRKDDDMKKLAKKCGGISDCKKFKECRRGEK